MHVADEQSDIPIEAGEEALEIAVKLAAALRKLLAREQQQIKLAIEQSQGVLEAAGGRSSQFLDHDSAQFTQILSVWPHQFQNHVLFVLVSGCQAVQFRQQVHQVFGQARAFGHLQTWMDEVQPFQTHLQRFPRAFCHRTENLWHNIGWGMVLGLFCIFEEEKKLRGS